MREQFKENTSCEKTYCVVNEYISIQRYENEAKITIYVRNEPLISIPGSGFPSFEYALQELNDNLVGQKNILENNKTKIIFQKLILSLNIWSKNDYDTNLLNYKIAFPLLKKLREVGKTKFQIIFQQEILKRYSTSLSEVKEYLEQEGYLNLIGDFF